MVIIPVDKLASQHSGPMLEIDRLISPRGPRCAGKNERFQIKESAGTQQESQQKSPVRRGLEILVARDPIHRFRFDFSKGHIDSQPVWTQAKCIILSDFQRHQVSIRQSARLVVHIDRAIRPPAGEGICPDQSQ
jgi:hypothetical protein